MTLPGINISIFDILVMLKYKHSLSLLLYSSFSDKYCLRWSIFLPYSLYFYVCWLFFFLILTDSLTHFTEMSWSVWKPCNLLHCASVSLCVEHTYQIWQLLRLNLPVETNKYSSCFISDLHFQYFKHILL